MFYDSLSDTHNAFLNDICFSLVSHYRSVQLWARVVPISFLQYSCLADGLTFSI